MEYTPGRGWDRALLWALLIADGRALTERMHDERQLKEVATENPAPPPAGHGMGVAMAAPSQPTAVPCPELAGRTNLRDLPEEIWCYMLDSSHPDIEARYGSCENFYWHVLEVAGGVRLCTTVGSRCRGGPLQHCLEAPPALPSPAVPPSLPPLCTPQTPPLLPPLPPPPPPPSPPSAPPLPSPPLPSIPSSPPPPPPPPLVPPSPRPPPTPAPPAEPPRSTPPPAAPCIARTGAAWGASDAQLVPLSFANSTVSSRNLGGFVVGTPPVLRFDGVGRLHDGRQFDLQVPSPCPLTPFTLPASPLPCLPHLCLTCPTPSPCPLNPLNPPAPPLPCLPHPLALPALQVSNESDYSAWNINANGLRNQAGGSFGVINLLTPRSPPTVVTWVELKLTFLRSGTAAEPLAPEATQLTFYDFDQGTSSSTGLHLHAIRTPHAARHSRAPIARGLHRP